MNKNSIQKNATMGSINISHSSQAYAHGNLNYLLNKFNINKDQFIIAVKDEFYDRNCLISKENIYDLICPICLNVLNNPKSCSFKNTSHSFCKKCIDTYLKSNNICPICKNQFNYKTNYKIESKLISTQFTCKYNIYGCKTILNYYQYFNHINDCKYKSRGAQYECQVEKYNYTNKNFEKCRFCSKIPNIENHFKKCAFTIYKCLFCNENILSINLKEHTEKECKIRFLSLNNAVKYIGEYYNNKREGFGKLYIDNQLVYEGQWKNDKKEGFGIFQITNNKYEGEWKDDKKHGYGILICGYPQKTIKFKGEFENDNFNGYGILETNGYKYEGNWKNNEFNGFCIITTSKGTKYFGELNNSTKTGYVEIYHHEGTIYKGQWNGEIKEGFGVLYYSNKIFYRGFWKNDRLEGYGKLYFNEDIFYEGEFKNGQKNGYGILSIKNKMVYKGQFKDDEMCGYGIMLISGKEKYEGEWKNNRKNGYGVLYEFNGSYKDEWKDNKKFGLGIAYCQGRSEGIFENDKLIISLCKSKYYSSVKGH